MSNLTTYASINSDYLLYDFTIYATTATITRSATEWRFTIPSTSSYTSSVTYVVIGTGLSTAAGDNFPTSGTITSIRGLDADGDYTFILTNTGLSAASLASQIGTNNIGGWQGALYGSTDSFTASTTAGVTMNAGADADVLRPGDAAGNFYGGGGNDTFYATNARANLYGGADTDTISFALAPTANYFINMAASNYGIIGGQNAYFYEFENATGGAGNDSIVGNNGENSLQGGAGDDTLFGGAGNDSLRGGTGIDTVSYAGASAALTVDLSITTAQLTSVETGTDQISEVENLIGGNGNDTLTGTTGANVIEGGAGNDSIDGGAGLDTASYAGAGSVNVSLAIVGAQNTGSAGTDTLVNIENLLGGSGNDTLTGRTTANALTGGGGNDVLVADAGNDTLDGGTGTDQADYSAATNALTIDLSKTTAQNLGALGSDVFRNIENLVTGTGNDSLTGTNVANDIRGGAGNDTIEGGEGNDTLYGGTGTDTASFQNAARGVVVNLGYPYVQTNVGVDYLYEFENVTGSAFNDTLSGDNNANLLTGGLGDDILMGAGGDDTMDGGSGTGDVASYASSGPVNVSLAISGAQNTGGGGTDTLIAIEGLTGSSYNDTLTGNAGHNLLEGGAGSDQLIGGAGNDTASYASATLGVNVSLAIAGPQDTLGAGTDTLTQMEGLRGGSGNDTLTGDAGVNVIEGGLGNDSMNGGSGVDTLSYQTSTAAVSVSLAITAVQDTLGAGLDRAVGFEFLAGGFGDDTLTGSTGNNRLTGNAGDDLLNGGLGNDTLDGSAGFDTADYSAATTAVTVNLAAATGQVTGPFGTDTLISVEKLILGSGADVVTGGTEAITVQAGSGNDTLTGGTAGDDLMGEIGNDSLNGGDGNDTLEGGVGNDTITGGDGIDAASYETATAGVRVNLATTTAQNTVGAGVDTITTVENLIGSAYADTLTGTTGNNDIRGGAGDDSINGGTGNDLLVGGQGDDTLIAGNGLDTLAGGGGNDVYQVQGTGTMMIEDTSGIDTLDASGAAGAANIDLSGATTTTIDGRIITFGEGGTSTLPLDLVFLQDLSGSFGDDIQNVRILAPQIVDAVQAVQPDAAFGVTSFVDKPISPFGSGGDYVYRTDLSVTTDEDAIGNTYNNLIILGGNDGPEASLEGLLQVAVRETEVGFRSDSARYVVLFTDAPYHVAGDGAAIGITTPNNGDNILDGTPAGTGEDYPGVSQVAAALLRAGIVPIFAVTAGNETTYQNLVDMLGFGTVVQLTTDSSNVVSAITTGLDVATATAIENAIGTAFGDTITGSDLANNLMGMGGNDTIYGRDGADTILGGAGNDRMDGEDGIDTASYADQTVAVRVSLASQGAAQNTLGAGLDTLFNFENLAGGSGNDSLYGDDGGNLVAGNDGADRLYGNEGNDTLEGGAGADSLYGNDGVDIASYANATTAVRANLTSAATNTGEAAGDIYSSVEGILGSAFNDTLTGNAVANILDGADGNDTLLGMAANDTLFGNFGDDSLDGGTDNDSLNGGAGADTLVGGAGNDSMNGGQDNDLFVMSTTSGDVDTVDGGLGTDTASFATFTTGVTVNLNSTTQSLPSGTAYFYGIENVRGGTGADNITGNNVANLIEGGNGNDTLTGGYGPDTLTGGSGADEFVFLLATDSTESLANRDQITDFNHSQGDKINVSAIDANSTLAGDQAFTLAAADFTGTAGEISISSWGTTHLIRFDTDGDGVANFAISAISSTALVASDFIL